MICSTLTSNRPVLTTRVIVRIRSINNSANLVLRLALVTVVLCTVSQLVRAQDPAPTPVPSAEESRLREENRLLELKKDNAQLKKEIKDTQPKPSATPLEGETTADANVIIETQMVTYKAMSDIADRIGAEIHQKFGGAKAIAIYDAEELENLKHYRATSPILEGRIEDLKDQYARVLLSLSAIPSLTTPTGASGESSDLTKKVHTFSAVKPLSGPTSSLTATSSLTSASILNPIASVTEGLKVFADLLALLRTDTDIKGKSVSVEESAMVAETFRALRNRFGGSVNLYYPKAVSPEVYLEGCQYNSAPVFCSETLSSLAHLYAEKDKADQELQRDMFDVASQFEKATNQKAQAAAGIASLGKQISELKLDQLKAELEKPWTPAQTARFQKYINELESMKAEAVLAKKTAELQLDHFAKRKNILEQLQALNLQADQLVATLAKPDEKTGRSELANFMRAENMEKAIGKDGYWLAFRSISAGGNNRTRKNLFRYFSGAKLDHSGGLIVEWALYNRNGVSVDSNKDSSYGGYLAPKEIQSAKFKDAVADPTTQPAPQGNNLAKSGSH
ncbi:MAG: hypothetical protein ABI596_00140 [Pyrinomonadaceae bacterium]